MKVRCTMVTAVAFLMLVSMQVFSEANPEGRWEGDSPQGPVAFTISKAGDGTLSGEFEAGPLGVVPLDEVALDGDTLTWSVEIDMQGQIIALSYSGAINGDAVDGTIDAGDYGQFPIPMRRAGAQPVAAEGGLLGEWDLKYEIQGNAVTAKLMLAKSQGDAYAGTWDSQFGKSDLKDVKVNGNSATFSRSVSAQGQEMDVSYTAMAEGDAISGTIAIPQLGDVPFTGTRIGGGAAKVAGGHLGTWNLEVDAQGQIFPVELTVGETGGALSVNTSTQMGESAGSDVAFENGKLTFVVVADAGGEQMSFAYTLNINGDTCEGTIGSDFGDMPVKGSRAAD